MSQNLTWTIIRNIFRSPLRTAVVDDYRQWRYIDLLMAAFYMAREIEKRTDKPHVGILLPTSGGFPAALLAVWMLGRTAVPINYLLSAEEQQYIIDDSEIDLLITADKMLDAIGAEPKNVQLLKLEKSMFSGFPPIRWPRPATVDQVAVILYTSGTSGKPKGVMLTHDNFYKNVTGAIAHARIRSGDTFLGVLPQFHSFGISPLCLVPLVARAKVVYTARFIPKKLIELIREHRANIFMAIPSMYNGLLTVKSAEKEDLESIRYAISGGEPLPDAVFEGFQDRFGIKILEGYGLTETSPVISWSLPGQWKYKSVGTLLPHAECRVVDDNGKVVPRGEEGEIHLRGDYIMKGYFKLPDLTDEVIDEEGWFKTGDWGKHDKDGYLFITGRKKEMLIIAGENVFPREIEEVLNHHPMVHDSAVVGRMDPSRGEVPIAFIELADEMSFDEAVLRAHVRKHLAGYKVPKEVVVIDELPRNPTGKILRRKLMDIVKTTEPGARIERGDI